MNETRGVSPTSDVFSDGLDSMSMRDKSLVKRSISKHHNNNFSAGYVPVHEQHLQKTGLRGRKTFAFWTLIGLLFLLAVGNLILTMTILGVLRLGQGMQSMELIPEEGAIKLFGNTDFKDIFKRNGRFEGYRDYPIDISAFNGSIVVKPDHKRPYYKMLMNKTGTIIRNISVFEIKDDDRKVIFSTNSPNLNINKNMGHLETKTIQSGRIVSPLNKKLVLEGQNINLKGSEGTWIEGREIFLTADQNITITSSNGSIKLDGQKGIHLDKLPKVSHKYNERIMQYKVCICLPKGELAEGKLFKIPVTKDNPRVYCDHINISHFNPCI